ncbi:SpaA isopeptide-forming pilin-related protein [Bifidobacterium adolescentis]|nr:SpaA isopeptide-forming pilin-related protein [Bifidobacterium adolescentis]MDB0594359.1 SpaA isopeptide-forming pilin-related protein [Bifidobacterium adolescentis]MDB0608766.1 SpaA isopeptide-forming pilin-related protein [Bifidobacterium adolescentis]
MRQWRNGAGNAPRHYAGTRSASGCALSRTRSLTAAAIAVAMMATVAVTSLLPAYNAKADESHNDGAICTPTSISLGTDTGSGTVDSGIATYVGGDMYVGRKASSGNMNNVNGPFGSYAAEAEGLTAVNGKLLMHPLKGLWTSYYTDKDGAKNGYVKDYKGFRFGIVGFGGQYRPATGSSTLEVRGNSSDNDISWVGGAQAWGNAGWVGQTKTSEPSYTANIAGASTNVYGGSSNDILGASDGSQNTNKNKYDQRNSVYVPSDTSGTVNWNQNDDQIGSTGETFDGFGSYIKTLSDNLSNLSKQQSDSVYVTNAKTTYSDENYTNLVRTKFDGTYSFTINSGHEKIIEFVGNGTSSMQVFNLPASTLNDSSSSYSGVSFSFKNIPDTSSVVINVTGENVDFHNGWRFWWTDTNGTTSELGGSYMKAAYAKRAQQIMWNFADASNVVIRGGQGSGTTTRSAKNSAAEKNDDVWDDSFPMKTNDDPAAGMLGSILVPNGSFESHVSTNGRVWVGGSFAMYNPDAVGNIGGDGIFYPFINYERSHSASALDMDQERHNLPWNGSYSTSCAAIKWDKVDAEGKTLKGTSWTVYGTRNNAMNGTNPITTVADGGWNDADDANNGSVTLGSLAKKATYYLKESGTGSSQYALNTNIYRIVTHDSTDTVSTIDKVYSATGAEITDDTAKQLYNGAIVNVSAGTSIAWSKVDAEDQNTLLAGSTWELTKKGDPDQSWTITDDDSDSEIANIVVKINETEVSSWSFTNSTPVSISYVAVDKDGKELATKVQWKSESPAVAGIASDGTQLQPYSNGTTNIVFTAGDKTVTFPVMVTGVTVVGSVSIDKYTEGQEISLEQGKTMTLTATVAPEGNTVNWTSSNPDEVSVTPTTGTIVRVTANRVTSGYVTITATKQHSREKATLKIKVTEPMVSVYFKKSNVQWNDYWLKYKKSTDSNNWSGDVQSSSACGDYVRFQLPKSSVTTNYQFYLGNAKGFDLPNDDKYTAANHGMFTFTGKDVQVVEAWNDFQKETVPSGCTVTSAYVENRFRRSAVKNAVFYDQPVVRAITNTTAKAADTRQDEDPKGGQFKVSDLTDGTYTLKETSAPNGFDVSKTKTYTIVIENGQVTSSGLPSAGNIENSRLTGTVNWKKTDETDTSKLLAGSEWKLYKTRNFSWDNGNAVYTETGSTDPVATIKDCVNSSEKTCSAQMGQYTDRDGEAGKFSIVGLEWGEYQLVESKAPDGYNIDTTPHVFRIGPAEGANVKGEWYTSSGFKPETTAGYQKSAAFTVDGGSITNTPGVVLPGTGGEGVNKMYAAGFLAVAIAVVGLALSLRRRQ